MRDKKIFGVRKAEFERMVWMGAIGSVLFSAMLLALFYVLGAEEKVPASGVEIAMASDPEESYERIREPSPLPKAARRMANDRVATRRSIAKESAPKRRAGTRNAPNHLAQFQDDVDIPRSKPPVDVGALSPSSLGENDRSQWSAGGGGGGPGAPAAGEGDGAGEGGAYMEQAKGASPSAARNSGFASRVRRGMRRALGMKPEGGQKGYAGNPGFADKSEGAGFLVASNDPYQQRMLVSPANQVDTSEGSSSEGTGTDEPGPQSDSDKTASGGGEGGSGGGSGSTDYNTETPEVDTGCAIDPNTGDCVDSKGDGKSSGKNGKSEGKGGKSEGKGGKGEGKGGKGEGKGGGKGGGKSGGKNEGSKSGGKGGKSGKG